jgi:hypothetical protein
MFDARQRVGIAAGGIDRTVTAVARASKSQVGVVTLVTCMTSTCW